MKKMLTNI